MPKINQEEYEVLKKKASDGYEWIARDESGSCFIYELKPVKNSRYEFWEWEGNEMIGKIFNSSLFQFIQWEDEEPYNIAELIEEYEREAKDKETDLYTRRMKYIAQAFSNLNSEGEETEVNFKERLKQEIRDVGILKHYIADDTAVEIELPILDSTIDKTPETLSQNWIDEHLFSLGDKYPWKEAVPVVDLQNLLVPKQEKVKIPEFIADYLPLVKEDIELEKASYYAVTNNELPKWKREYDWIRENFETFVKAWLAYPNIEVEEEQKYYVMDKNDGLILRRNTDKEYDDRVAYPDSGRRLIHMKEHEEEYLYQFTEREIKEYDEKYWAFRRPVKELEE